MNLFQPPPPTQWNVLNLGAGVQSSCLALMAAKGEITPMPDFAVFADTQDEPNSVYKWLQYIKGELPFPVYELSKGKLSDSINVRLMRDGKRLSVESNIPAFTDGGGMIQRQCTSKYKIQPIISEIRKRCGIKRGQKETIVTQWIGISWDEMQRMKESRDSWTQHRWPLIELRMARRDCLDWLKRNEYPIPPRSACIYCPYKRDSEWRELKINSPSEFESACEIDERYRQNKKIAGRGKDVFIHRSLKPLREVDFSSDEDNGQQVWDFQAECEGMCGV
jgi:hypothetical protein